MAQTLAALVQAVTASTGTNDYVLEDPASQGPLRTDVQAVADGSLSNGQIIHYMVRDTTVTGDASFEEGYGVYASATRTVSRSAGNVIDGSNGPGTLVVWGASGQRDFYILRPLNGEDVVDGDAFCDTVGAARLNTANIYTGGIQSILPASGEGQIRVRHGSGAVTWALRPTTSDKCEWRDITNSKIPLSADPNGGNVAVGTGYTLVDPSTTPYEAFPSGFAMLAESVPTGWTRSDQTQSRLIRMSKSGDTLGATGGGDDIFDGSWATAGHTLQISEIPSHDHDVDTYPGSGSVSSAAVQRTVNAGGETGVSSVGAALSTGGGASHLHNMTTPYYRIMARIVKS